MAVQALSRNLRDEIYQGTLAAVKREVAQTEGNPESLIGHCLEIAWQGYLLIKAWPGAPRSKRGMPQQYFDRIVTASTGSAFDP